MIMRRIGMTILLVLIFCILGGLGSALAERTLSLPASLEVIEDEAFMNDTSLERVVVPEGVRRIGARAFAGSSASWVELPGSLTDIADDAFDGCAGLKATAPEGTYACRWAVAHGLMQPGANAPSDFTYEIVNGECTIKHYKGTATDVVFPDFIEGAPVTSLDTYTFLNKEEMPTSVVLPAHLKHISSWTLASCKALRSVTFPEGCAPEEIEQYAFAYDTALVEVRLPERCQPIAWPDYMFVGCEALENIDIPEGVTRLGLSAFENCIALKEIDVPSSVREIAEKAFSNCRALETVTLHEGLESIGKWAFLSSSAIKALYIPDSVTYIDFHPFDGCLGMRELRIGGGIREITKDQFTLCNTFSASRLELETVIIAEGVEVIGDYVFSNEGYQYSGQIDMYKKYYPKLAHVVLPRSLVSIGRFAFAAAAELTSVEIPEGSKLTTIGDYAFYRCAALPAIDLTNATRLETLGERAFKECEALQEVKLPKGSPLRAIQKETFYKCAALRSMRVPEGITSIGESALGGCTSLESLYIPDSVTEMEQSAIYAPALRTVEVGGGFPVPRNIWSSSAKTLETIIFHEGVTELPGSAFRGFAKLTRVSLPASMTTIGDGAFQGCAALPELRLPSGLTAIGKNLFNGCSALREIAVPASVTAIGENAFQNCSALTTADAPGVETIAKDAFNGCAALVTANIPRAATLGLDAFNGCAALKDVRLAAITDIGERAFYGTGLESIDLPEGLVSIGKNAFASCLRLERMCLPDSVTNIGYDFLLGDEALDVLEWGAGVPDPKVEQLRVLSTGAPIRKLVLREGVNSLPKDAFSNAAYLSDVTLPASLKTLGENAFSGCAALREISLKEGLRTIGNSAFANCASLQSMKVPDSVTSLGNDAFCGDLAMTFFQLGGGISSPTLQQIRLSMNPDASSALETLVVSEGVKTIPASAFAKSGSSASTVAKSSVPANCAYPKLTSITLPASIKSIGKDAFKDSISLGFGVTIYGVTGSYAHSWAFAQGIKFIANGVEEAITEQQFKELLSQLKPGENPLENHSIFLIMYQRLFELFQGYKSDEECKKFAIDSLVLVRLAPAEFRDLYVHTFFEYNLSPKKFDKNNQKCFVPLTNTIHLDYEVIDVNALTSDFYATLFHETGHAIDHNTASRLHLSNDTYTFGNMEPAIMDTRLWLSDMMLWWRTERMKNEGAADISTEDANAIIEAVLDPRNHDTKYGTIGNDYDKDGNPIITVAQAEGLDQALQSYYADFVGFCCLGYEVTLTDEEKNLLAEAGYEYEIIEYKVSRCDANMYTDLVTSVTNRAVHPANPGHDKEGYWYKYDAKKGYQPTYMTMKEAWAEYFSSQMISSQSDFYLKSNRTVAYNTCKYFDENVLPAMKNAFGVP